VLSTLRELQRQGGGLDAIRALRWLLPTAVFETLRSVDRRYLSEPDFRHAITEAGFDVLDLRETFLAGISRVAWTRVGPSVTG
jgi:hypothetical protein